MEGKCKIKIKASFEKGINSTLKGDTICILESLAEIYTNVCIDCGVDKNNALKAIKDNFELNLKERNK